MRKLLFNIVMLLVISVGALHRNAMALTNTCNALELARKEDWKAAAQCAHSQKDPTLLKLVLWSKYANRGSDAKTEEILNFITENPHFPDNSSLVATAENKINNNTNTAVLKRWFSNHTPLTDNGVKYYFYLMENKMNKKEHEEWIKKAWINSHHDKKESSFFLAKFKPRLSHQDHMAKINHMLAIGHTRIGDHLLKLLDKDHQALVKARLKIARNEGWSLEANLKEVPDSLKSDSNLLHAQASFYERKGKYSKIAELIQANQKQDSLKSDLWSKIRTRTAVELHQKGKNSLAYQISSTHNYTIPVNYVDAELFSGKIALFYLNDYNASLKHFKHVLDKAKFPATSAKAAYWCGVSCSKLGLKTEAHKYFNIAAKHLGTFYGQVSNMRLNKKTIKLEYSIPEIYKSDIDWIENNELVRSSKMLAANNDFVLTKKFTNHTYTKADTMGKRYLLARIGNQNQLPNLSVAYNKIAEKDGIFSPKDSYPTVSIQPIGDAKNIDPALVLAVIRQESEFHSKATSPAGAVGLMQIMYATAQNISKNLDIQINQQSLYNPQVNVEIGSYYLSKLLKRYNNNYILAIAAYNAGPTVVDKWTRQYGDPRNIANSPQEAAEWVEKIPYYETRTYVQHVLSNVQMYRNILDHQEEETPLRELHIDLTRDLSKSA
jgi:soluble lytic murein transglycosylase